MQKKSAMRRPWQGMRSALSTEESCALALASMPVIDQKKIPSLSSLIRQLMLPRVLAGCCLWTHRLLKLVGRRVATGSATGKTVRGRGDAVLGGVVEGERRERGWRWKEGWEREGGTCGGGGRERRRGGLDGEEEDGVWILRLRVREREREEG